MLAKVRTSFSLQLEPQSWVSARLKEERETEDQQATTSRVQAGDYGGQTLAGAEGRRGHLEKCAADWM